MSLRQFVSGVLPRQELFKIGIGGFTALARTRESTHLQGKAPDVVLEDATTIQEHFVLEPKTFTIEGWVSEEHQSRDFGEQINEYIEDVFLRTSVYDISHFPELIRVEALAQNDRIERTLDTLTEQFESIDSFSGFANLVGDLAASSVNTLVDRFISYIIGVYDSRTLISIDCTDRTWHNIMITGATLQRNNRLNAVNFNLKLKQIRFASLERSNVRYSRVADNAATLPSSAGRAGSFNVPENTSVLRYMQQDPSALNNVVQDTIGEVDELSNFIREALRGSQP